MKKNKITGCLCFIVPVLLVILLISGIKPMIVMSGSMEPAIRTGSICFVNTNASYKNIKEDDVITYNLLDSLVTHRVISVTDRGIITKGDANSSEDIGIVTEENFYGRVLFHIPYAGYVLWMIRRHPLLFLTIVPAAAFFPYELIRETGKNKYERRVLAGDEQNICK